MLFNADRSRSSRLDCCFAVPQLQIAFNRFCHENEFNVNIKSFDHLIFCSRETGYLHSS